MNRKTLSLVSSLCSVAALAACASVRADDAPAVRPSPSAREDFGTTAKVAPVSQLAISEFMSDASGFDTKSFFLDTGREVVVFDAQFTPALAERLLAAIAAQTKSPVTHVVVTHPNPDKFGGLSVFHSRGIKIVASAATARAMPGVHAYKKNFFVNVAKMFTEDTFPALVAPDVTFQDRLTLRLQGETVELVELGRAGVSGNQTLAYAKGAKALFVGDLVHANVHAWLEGGIVDGAPRPDIAGWKALLAALPGRYPASTTVYGGRGDSLSLGEAARWQIAYLDKADALVGDYVRALGDRKAELAGEKGGEHFAALAQLFAEAFPGVGLPQMIQYGVYGLALTVK